MLPTHPDYIELKKIADQVTLRAGGLKKLEADFPLMVREVIDSIIDPARTGRTRFEDLVNVEKTFIGLKIEHVLRDLIDVPSGLRDLVIDGMDVDVKNTVRDTWTIPPETYLKEEPCILIRSNEATLQCWLGVMFAKEAYLNPSLNRDDKRSVSAASRRNHIMWILDGVSYPAGHWEGIDTERFRELREIKGGNQRASIFMRENLGRKIHRSVIQALLYDQLDYMKRMRGNGGIRDILGPEGIAVLSGAYDAPLAKQLGYGILLKDEFLAISPSDQQQADLLQSMGHIS
ncbi:NaeI family type II restriction endonuclease [Paracoccus yeei]|uniref:NaeI family type II restriction endonuclease n=1 Tax=Paracoccus yeei TaxID=147645 RepID=UPI003BF8ECE2